jgi:hypothetical protein
MGITEAIAVSSVQLFKLRLLGRMQSLARETGESRFVVPVAFFLLHDEPHGGELGGAELERRFGLKDFELPHLIDLYFFGWSYSRISPSSGGLKFDLRSCEGFRRALRSAGIQGITGQADLVMVDAAYGADGTVRLNFSQAVRLDLAAATAERRVPALGGLLQSLADLIEALKAAPGEANLPFRVSSPLGIAVGAGSLVNWFLDRWTAQLGIPGFGAAALYGLGKDLSLIDL